MKTLLVEAALFSSGRPISIKEMKEATSLKESEIKNALEWLMKKYGNRARKDETSLEIAKCGEKYAMQLRARYVEYVKKLAKMEVPEKLLKTLALIAYHQPLEQSRLAKMIGNKAYDHVKELHELGLIRTKKHGRTKLLTTSGAFPEYFGFGTTDKKKIAEYLERKLGLE